MYSENTLDPIHGQIKLSEIKKWISGQKPFNSLRGIIEQTYPFSLD